MDDGRPLRVAITVGPAGPGGIATYTRELIDALALRTDVELTVIGTDAAIAELRSEPAEAIRCRGGRLAEQAHLALLGPALRRRGIDVVHGTRHLVPLAASPARVLTFHDDFAFTRRDDYDLVKRTLLPPIYRRALGVADAIVTLAPEVADDARRHVGPGTPVVCTGAAVSSELAAADTTHPPDGLPDRYALVVGDAGPRKRVDWLLDRWDPLSAVTGLGLVVAGGRAASPELVARLTASSAVFRRTPSTDELAALYANASVVIDAAATEGYGFVRVEAAHFGIPYVAFRDGADPADLLHGALGGTSVDAPAPTGPSDGSWVDSWDDVAERTVEVYRLAIERCA